MTNTKKKNVTEKTFRENLGAYWKGLQSEWGKITWPEKRQVIFDVVTVLCVVIFFIIVVYFYDIIFKLLLGLMTPK